MKSRELIRSLNFMLERGGDVYGAYLLGFKDDFEYASSKELTEDQWALIADDFSQNAPMDNNALKASVEFILEELNG